MLHASPLPVPPPTNPLSLNPLRKLPNPRLKARFTRSGSPRVTARTRLELAPSRSIFATSVPFRAYLNGQGDARSPHTPQYARPPNPDGIVNEDRCTKDLGRRAGQETLVYIPLITSHTPQVTLARRGSNLVGFYYDVSGKVLSQHNIKKEVEKRIRAGKYPVMLFHLFGSRSVTIVGFIIAWRGMSYYPNMNL